MASRRRHVAPRYRRAALQGLTQSHVHCSDLVALPLQWLQLRLVDVTIAVIVFLLAFLLIVNAVLAASRELRVIGLQRTV